MWKLKEKLLSSGHTRIQSVYEDDEATPLPSISREYFPDVDGSGYERGDTSRQHFTNDEDSDQLLTGQEEYRRGVGRQDGYITPQLSPPLPTKNEIKRKRKFDYWFWGSVAFCLGAFI